MELLLSIVVASATLIYTVVTIFQLVESRKNRFLKESPNIVPFLKTTEEHSVLQLIIKNFGEGIAKNVKISFSKDFNRFGKEKKLSDIGIAKYGMNYFPPQYELKFDIHWMNDICNSHQGDDIEIIINGKNARAFASQGQQRSAVLSLKLAEASVLRERMGEEPVILLDDVLSELDAKRQDFLLNELHGCQVFITCCEKSNKEQLKDGKIFLLNNGEVS